MNHQLRTNLDRRLGEDRRKAVADAVFAAGEDRRSAARRKAIEDRRAAAVLNARQQRFYECWQAAQA